MSSSPAVARISHARIAETKRRVHRIARVDFDLISATECLNHILQWADEGLAGSVSLVNPHSVMLCRRDPEMRDAIERSSLTLPDGVGIVLGARLLRYTHSGRTSGPELMLHLCGEGRNHGLRHYFYGGEPGIARQLAERLKQTFPGLQVAGHYTPPFRTLTAEEDRRIVEDINDAAPDIVWVGLGAPKQEKWIASHQDLIKASALIGVGAAFDFHSGNIPWCPAPIRKAGLEWSYRLVKEPRRMWRRNLDSFFFLGMVAMQKVRGKS